MLNSKKTGWPVNMSSHFKDFDTFKEWYDNRYTGEKAETIWKKTGGTIEKKVNTTQETKEG